MTAGERVPDADQRTVRRAVASVTRQISVATLALVVFIVILAVVFVVWQSQPSELAESAHAGEDKIYVDADAVLVALGVIGLGAIGFAGVISWFIARRAVRPLGRALELQRSFVADASHELRTPLAVLDARLQLLQRRIQAQDPNAATVAELRQDSAALIGIVNELLAAAGGEQTEPGEVTDVSAEAAEVVAALRLLGEQRGIGIALSAEPGLRVRMAAVSFRRCVTALVDNALAHTPDGGAVEVVLAGGSGRVALSVVDHGAGIRGIAPERVFERFAHFDPDGEGGVPRRRGFGIGLALVRDVAVRAGGEVRVDSTGPDGTTIVLELPRA